MVLKVVILIIISTLLDSIGQLCFKSGVNSIEKKSFANFKDFMLFLGGVIQNFKIWLGILTYGLELVVWLMAISLADLSFVFPISSMNYIFVIAGSKILLREKIGLIRWLGTILILSGIILITSS